MDNGARTDAGRRLVDCIRRKGGRVDSKYPQADFVELVQIIGQILDGAKAKKPWVAINLMSRDRGEPSIQGVLWNAFGGSSMEQG